VCCVQSVRTWERGRRPGLEECAGRPRCTAHRSPGGPAARRPLVRPRFPSNMTLGPPLLAVALPNVVYAPVALRGGREVEVAFKGPKVGAYKGGCHSKQRQWKNKTC